MENFYIKYVTFREELDYYDLLKINDKTNPETKILVKILKLTNQMISKSRNSHMNRKLTIRGFQRDQNEQSLIKHQIEGSNVDESLRIRYRQKAGETRNPMKLKSNNLDLRSGRNPCSKIRKIL